MNKSLMYGWCVDDAGSAQIQIQHYTPFETSNLLTIASDSSSQVRFISLQWVIFIYLFNPSMKNRLDKLAI